eukprot:m.344541 g.344541  ORF g.344541 m.344541 type:complete len:515 (+) comp24640_c0_seq1:152-1696(+)
MGACCGKNSYNVDSTDTVVHIPSRENRLDILQENYEHSPTITRKDQELDAVTFEEDEGQQLVSIIQLENEQETFIGAHNNNNDESTIVLKIENEEERKKEKEKLKAERKITVFSNNSETDIDTSHCSVIVLDDENSRNNVDVDNINARIDEEERNPVHKFPTPKKSQQTEVLVLEDDVANLEIEDAKEMVRDICCKEGQHGLRKLLERDIILQAVNELTKSGGQTPLNLAVRNERHNVMLDLLDFGFATTQYEATNEYPLKVALEADKIQLVEEILAFTDRDCLTENEDEILELVEEQLNDAKQHNHHFKLYVLKGLEDKLNQRLDIPDVLLRSDAACRVWQGAIIPGSDKNEVLFSEAYKWLSTRMRRESSGDEEGQLDHKAFKQVLFTIAAHSYDFASQENSQHAAAECFRCIYKQANLIEEKMAFKVHELMQNDFGLSKPFYDFPSSSPNQEQYLHLLRTTMEKNVEACIESFNFEDKIATAKEAMLAYDKLGGELCRSVRNVSFGLIKGL